MHRRIAHSLLLLVCLAASGLGQIVPGRYIVELSTEPVEGLGSAERVAKGGAALRRSAVRSQQAQVRQAVAERSAAIVGAVDTVANALFVEVSDDAAASLRSIPGVVRVTPVRLYKKMLDRAVELQKITGAWSIAGGANRAGAGIKIGIIDSGIDSSHPAFQAPGLTVPDGFPKVSRDVDLALTNNKVIVARNYGRRGSAIDQDGHGTAVAAIAAGVTASSSINTVTGVAPGAFLGNYKVFPDGQDGAPTDYIMEALEDAYEDGMDIANLSLGSFPALRPEDDPLVQAVERAVTLGMIVVVAAGNEGPDMNTIGSPATSYAAIAVGNAYTDRIFASTARMEGAAPVVAVPGSGRNSSAPIVAGVVDAASLDTNGEACAALPPDSLAGKIALVYRGTCFFSEKLDNVRRAGAVAAVVYARPEDPDPITMGVGDSLLPAAMVSYGDGVSLKQHLGANPASSMTLDFTRRPFTVASNRLSPGTSQGPNVDLSLKPDLVAVGASVFTAGIGNTFIVNSGTSFSAPMVSGAAAILKAARPGLTPADYRGLLVGSASAFGTGLTVQQTGAGLLDATAAMRSTVSAAPSALSFRSGGGTVNLMRVVTLKNVGAAADTLTITAVPTGDGPIPSLSRNTVDLGPGGTAEIEVKLEGSNLGSRAYEGLLVVRSTQSNVETRIPYWYAVPGQTGSIISLVAPPESGSTSSRHEIVFRTLDSAGVPLLGEPKITAVSGEGSTMGIESYDEVIPGLYVATVRLSAAPGDNVFEIEANGITRRFTISAE